MQKSLQDFDFSTNPFESIISGMGQQAAPQAGQPMSPQGMPAQMPQEQQAQAPAPQGMYSKPGMEEEEPEEDQLKRGQNPSRSTYLVKAMTALEDFVTNTTDRTEIMFARGLMSAISRLMNRDQEGLRTKAMSPEQPAPMMS